MDQAAKTLKEPKRAAIYVRVSSDMQLDGYSLQTQAEKCQEYADRHNLTVVATFQDTHTSAELDRPGLNKLCEAAEEGEMEVLIVYAIDRLSRDLGKQAIIEMEMSRSNVDIVYVLDDYEDTPNGELMKLIKTSIVQYETRQRAERFRRGRRGRAQAGYVICPTGRAPFGYTYISEPHKGWLVVNENEAEVVRKIYRWITHDGLSSYAIAKKLWEENILTRGDYSEVVHKKKGPGAWSPATVRGIIKNTVYKGVWYYGKTRRTKVNGKIRQVKRPKSEWIAVDVPAIVDERTWEEAQVCLKRNQRRPKHPHRKYFLRSLIFCTCGRRWGGRYKTRLQRAYYRCYANAQKHWMSECHSKFSYRQEVLERVIWEKVCSLFLDPDTFAVELARKRETSEAGAARYRSRMKAIDAALEENERKMGVLLDEVLMGGFAESLIEGRKRGLTEEREQLLVEQQHVQEEIDALTVSQEKEKAIAALAEQIGEAPEETSWDMKRQLFELLEVRIDVIDKTHAKLSGIMCVDGVIVEVPRSKHSR